MASAKLEAYVPSPRPSLQGSDLKWLQEELKKLEKTLNSIAVAIRELQSYHP